MAVERRIGGFKADNSEDLLKEAAELGVRPTPLRAENRKTIDWLCGRAPG